MNQRKKENFCMDLAHNIFMVKIVLLSENVLQETYLLMY